MESTVITSQTPVSILSRLDAVSQKVVIERRYDADEWLLLHPSGLVEIFLKPEDAFTSVQRSVKRTLRREKKHAVITVIEWRNVPDGFTPPAGLATAE